MNARGHIYRAPEDEIPFEDKQRLDDYLDVLGEEEDAQIRQERIEKIEARQARASSA